MNFYKGKIRHNNKTFWKRSSHTQSRLYQTPWEGNKYILNRLSSAFLGYPKWLGYLFVTPRQTVCLLEGLPPSNHLTPGEHRKNDFFLVFENATDCRPSVFMRI